MMPRQVTEPDRETAREAALMIQQAALQDSYLFPDALRLLHHVPGAWGIILHAVEGSGSCAVYIMPGLQEGEEDGT